MPLTERESRVCQAISRRADHLLSDLRLHVGLPTGHNNTSALDESRAHFSSRCEKLGARCELVPGDPKPDWLWEGAASTGSHHIPPTLIARKLTGAAPGSALLISGHLDTVHDPRGPFRELSIAPDRKNATGPGCVDMKGGLVIAINALEVLADLGVDLPWSMMLNSDEETGSFHSDRALRAEAGAGHYRYGLALEPAMSKGELAIERGGSGQFIIEATGQAAHVGRDFASGRSAVDALAHAIIDAHKLSDAPHGVCVNISPLSCDIPANVVADSARAWGNVRYPNPEAGTKLEHALLTLGPREGLPRVHIRTSLNRPAKPCTPQVRALADLVCAAASDLGQNLLTGKTAGVCDGNNLQAAGLPTLDTLGVRGGGLHTPTEWIELASLVERCQLLALVMLRAGSPRA